MLSTGPCLRVLNIEYALTEEELNRIPSRGPLIMVANHPFGGVESIILSEVLLQARPDVRILGNYLLAFNVDMAFADVIDGLFGPICSKPNQKSWSVFWDPMALTDFPIPQSGIGFQGRLRARAKK